jgi:hypothetical protein
MTLIVKFCGWVQYSSTIICVQRHVALWESVGTRTARVQVVPIESSVVNKRSKMRSTRIAVGAANLVTSLFIQDIAKSVDIQDFLYLCVDELRVICAASHSSRQQTLLWFFSWRICLK